jgi:hypothetical protein
MAAGSTYTPLATTTLGSATASVTFSSISGAYTDLVLVISPASSAQKDVDIRLNGDTGTNYSRTVLTGNGTSAASSRTTSDASAYITYYAATNTTLGNSVFIVNFMNYSNTTTYKTMLARANNASTGVDAAVALWRNTAAITSIALTPAGGSFEQYTTASLYGIKNS